MNLHYSGLLAQPAVFGTALDATQIGNLYAAALPEPGSLACITLAAGALLARRRR